jgi:S-layer protein
VTGVAAVAAITGRAGVANGAVTIADGGNASITDITVDGYAASTINANALTNLTLKNSGATGTMAVTTTSTGAMTLNLDDVDAAVNLDAGGASITNLTVNTSGTASTGAIAAAAATTVTINAEAALSGASAYTAATLIDVNGSAAVNLTGAIANATTLQTIDASGNTGGVTVVLGATNDVKFTGGTGNDALTIAIDGVLVGDDVDMGAGNDTLTMLALTAAANIATTTALQGGEGTDTLALTIASADNVALSASTAFNAKIDGFEKVSLTHSAAGAETVDLANIDGISYVISANSTAAAAGLSNMANNGTLELTTAGVGMDVFMADSTSTTADVFNIVLDDSLTAAGVAAGIVAVSAAAAAVNQNGVETINISVDDTFVDVTGALDEFGAAIGDGVDDTNAVFSLTVTDSATTTSSYSTVNVTGAGDLTLTTATNVATSNLTTVDASTMTGILTYTTTAANMTVTGGSAADVITANTNGVTINGGAGNDTLVVADNMDLVKLNGGAGTDTFDINGASSNKSNYAVIQDAASGDIINLAGVDGNAGATTNLTAFNATQITLAQGATESTQAYLDQAMTTLANGAVGWFQYNGNTFVTADVGGDSANSFVDGTDFVIMLTGTYDLSTASFNATSDTLELA